MEFKDKYLKYKVKYLELKQYGSGKKKKSTQLVSTSNKSVGYDFDGVLHRSISEYKFTPAGTVYGRNNDTIKIENYIPNKYILNDMLMHIKNGDNVYIISRNPDKSGKITFLERNNPEIATYFKANPGNNIVEPMSNSKGVSIKRFNISKFVEDSDMELEFIKSFNNYDTELQLYFVNTIDNVMNKKKKTCEPGLSLYSIIKQSAVKPQVPTVKPPTVKPPTVVKPLHVVKPPTVKTTSKKTLTDKIILLSYNVYFGSFVKGAGGHAPHLKNGKKIISLINHVKPDIMVLCESSPLIPQIKVGEPMHYNSITLPDYRTMDGAFLKNVIFYGRKGTGGTMIYWSNKFEKYITPGAPLYQGLSIYKGNTAFNYGRPCIGIKLRHKESKKIYLVIGVHLDHHISISDYQRGINLILTNLKYDNRSEEIIIMGDHNEIYETHKQKNINFNSNRLTLKQNYGKTPDGTCCGKDTSSSHPGVYNRPFDLVYTNVNGLNMRAVRTEKSGGSDHSDHYPIVGGFPITYKK